MSAIWPLFGDLHQTFANQPFWAGLLLIFASILSGTLIGIEREKRDKPAGLRTLTLICVGSTIFTLASIYIGDSYHADRARIAAQVAPGVGFLGAGAIIRHRGTIIGLTTGATVWVVAALGVLIGTGYAAAGIGLALVVLSMLTFVHRFERRFVDPCQWTKCRIIFESDRGKTRIRILQILDAFRVPLGGWQFVTFDGHDAIEIQYCYAHRHHRAFLSRLVELDDVLEFQGDLPYQNTPLKTLD